MPAISVECGFTNIRRPAKPASCRFLSSIAPTVCVLDVAPTKTIARGLKILSRLRTDMTRILSGRRFNTVSREGARVVVGRTVPSPPTRRRAGPRYATVAIRDPRCLAAELACSRDADLPSGSRRASPLEREGAVEVERVVLACVAAGSVEVRGSAVEVVEQRILQAEANVQPWPPAWAAVTERQVVRLEDPAVGIRAAVVGRQAAEQQRILRAADVEVRHVDSVDVIIEIARLRLERVELLVRTL